MMSLMASIQAHPWLFKAGPGPEGAGKIHHQSWTFIWTSGPVCDMSHQSSPAWLCPDHSPANQWTGLEPKWTRWASIQSRIHRSKPGLIQWRSPSKVPTPAQNAYLRGTQVQVTEVGRGYYGQEAKCWTIRCQGSRRALASGGRVV